MRNKMVMKECCGTCGLPVDIERKPVIITNNMLSIITYEENRCEECGHQFDGTSLPRVYEHWQKLANKFITEREELIKFLKHYQYLDKEERREICVWLPMFMGNKKTTMENMDTLRPYNWDVVYQEVLENTPLSKVMVRDIEWKDQQ